METTSNERIFPHAATIRMRIAKAKPCPFCGSSDSFTERHLRTRQQVCNGCFAHGPSVDDYGHDLDDTKASAFAVREWNKRKRAGKPA